MSRGSVTRLHKEVSRVVSTSDAAAQKLHELALGTVAEVWARMRALLYHPDISPPTALEVGRLMLAYVAPPPTSVAPAKESAHAVDLARFTPDELVAAKAWIRAQERVEGEGQ